MQYAVKCDQCKQTVRWTDDPRESAAGIAACAECAPEDQIVTGPITCVGLNAGHDRSGNPRRVWVVMGALGEILEAIDEGYRGFGAVKEKYDVVQGPMFNAPVSEYKNLLRTYGRRS